MTTAPTPGISARASDLVRISLLSLLAAGFVAASPPPAAGQATPPPHPNLKYDDLSGDLPGGVSTGATIAGVVVGVAVVGLAYYFTRANKPPIALEPAVPRFTVATLTEPTRLSLTMENKGGASVVVRSVDVTGDGFSVAEMPELPLTLAPGARAHFSLGFAPTQVRDYAGRLRITTGGGGQKAKALTAPLQGRGVTEASAPQMTRDQPAAARAPTNPPTEREPLPVPW